MLQYIWDILYILNRNGVRTHAAGSTADQANALRHCGTSADIPAIGEGVVDQMWIKILYKLEHFEKIKAVLS